MTGWFAWTHAAYGFVIVSKDVGFPQRAMRRGPPANAVRTLVGNCTAAGMSTLVRGHHRTPVAFQTDPTAAFITFG